jgi:hypothetical protein
MRLSTLVVVLLLAAVAFGGTPKKFGKAVTLKETTRVSEILADPEKFDGRRVLVQGPVVDVCAKRGCWIRVGSDKEFETIQFKVDDGVIVFPMDAKGRSVRAEGIVSVTTTSKEELIEQGRREAKESGEKFDPSTVKGPRTIVRIMGEGAVLQ